MTLSRSIIKLFEARKIVFSSEEGLELLEKYSQVTDELKNIYLKNDLSELLNAEFKLLEYEKKIAKPNTVADTSITNALNDYQLVVTSVNNVKDSSFYNKFLQNTGYNNRDKDGLPIDATRSFLNKHIDRLTKRRTEPDLESAQIEALTQRRANMVLAKELYKDLQKKALFAEQDRTYLIVQKGDEQLVKGNGAKFDEEKKRWFTISNNPRNDSIFSYFEKCDSDGNSLSVKNQDKSSKRSRMR